MSETLSSRLLLAQVACTVPTLVACCIPQRLVCLEGREAIVDAKGSVHGTDQRHDVLLLGLSTCIWCRRTREMLEAENVSFRYVYFDLLQEQEKETYLELLRTWNPRESYPTVIIDDQSCVIGHKPEELKKALV